MKKAGKLISHIRASSRGMIRQLGLLDNRFSAIGSTSQCHAMVELDTNGPMNAAQLSEALNLEKSTVSRLVMQMSDEGICHIQVDEDDRRNKLITLTKKGLSLVNKIHAEAELQVENALNLMTEEEKDIVARGLALYAQALKKSSVSSEDVTRKKKIIK